MRTRSGIEIEKRTVYGQMGKGKRTVYDAKGNLNGIEYHACDAASKQEAEQQALSFIDFARRNPPIEALGFSLKPNSVDGFSLWFPHGGGYMFGALSRETAIDKIADEYEPEHPVQEFVREARRLLTSATEVK